MRASWVGLAASRSLRSAPLQGAPVGMTGWLRVQTFVWVMRGLVVGVVFTICSVAGSAQTVASAPLFSPAPGTFSGTATVTLSDATANTEIHYTLDGSAPDYTSPLYTGPITISSTQTLNAIAGVVGTKQKNGSGATTYWKAPDHSDAGGSGVPTLISNPTGGAGTGNGDNGLLHSGCYSNGGAGPCLSFYMTPPSGTQTNVLWAKSSSIPGSRCDRCTWMVGDHWIEYIDPSNVVSAWENDDYLWDLTDEYNIQGSGQYCTGNGGASNCPGGHADLDVGGNASAHWTATNIRPTLTQNVWHHIVKEESWKTAELTTKPCRSIGGTAFPCVYWNKWILDGTVYNLQSGAISTGGTFNPCSSNGCKLAMEGLGFGVGYATDQFQTDSHTSSPARTTQILDSSTFTAYYDPSAVTTGTYTIATSRIAATPVSLTVTPTLVSAYVTAPGGVTAMTVGGSLQLSAFCHYTSGADQNCTGTDIYGHSVTAWATSDATRVTVGATGLVSAVGVGSASVSATVNGSVVSPGLGLTVAGPSVTLTRVSLAAGGGSTSVGLGQTNQLAATCGYSDGSSTVCTTVDAHGNVAGGWSSSNSALATVSSTGLVMGLATGAVTFTASAGGVTSAGLPLVVNPLPSGTYKITLQGPVTVTGTVTF